MGRVISFECAYDETLMEVSIGMQGRNLEDVIFSIGDNGNDQSRQVLLSRGDQIALMNALRDHINRRRK